MLRKMTSAIAFVLSLVATHSAAQSPHQNVTEVLSAHGCTLGPKSRKAALAGGLTAAEIDAARDWAIENGYASVQRDWVVLDAAICQITLPKFTPEVSLQDPDIQQTIYEITQKDVAAHAHEDDPRYITEDIGCFLYNVPEVLKLRPGWDAERADLSYHELVGEGLVTGELRFYTTSILRTPPIIRVMTEKCAQVPFGPQIEANHQVLVQEFPNFVRHRFANVHCDGSSFEANMEFLEKLGARNTGALLDLEYELIAILSGWTTANTIIQSGDMRPPMCHYTPPSSSFSGS